MHLNNIFSNFFNNGKGKIKYFLFFFFISLSFWMITKLSNDYNSVISFDLKFEKIPKYILLNEPASSKVDVSIKTSGFQFIYHKIFKKKINVDVSNEISYNENFKYNTESLIYLIKDRFDSETEIKAIFPNEILLKFSKKTRKRVKVVPPSDIIFKNGYGLSEKIILVPDSVWISGNGELLDSINSLKTKLLNNQTIESSISDYTLDVINPNKNFYIEPNVVKSQIKIERFSEKIFLVPLKVKNLPDSIGIKLFPNQVKVIFSSSLSKIKHIKANDFKFNVDFNKIGEQNEKYLKINLDSLPNFLAKIRWSPKKVEFLLRN